MTEPTKFGEVGPPWWDDKPAILVATGTSLKGFDFDRLRGLGYVLAIKNSVWDMPWADACFGLDLPWMKREQVRLEELASKMALYLAVPDQFPPIHTHIEGAIFIRRDVRTGPVSLRQHTIEAGGNSGFGGFNLAVLKKPRLIYLFGFDYLSDHYCPERYTHNPPNHNARYLQGWARNFGSSLPTLAKLGIEVINASPRSLVGAFKKVDLEQAVDHLHRLRSERERGVCSGEVVGASSPQREGADPWHHPSEAPP